MPLSFHHFGPNREAFQKAPFYDDPTYAKILDGLVVACTDVIICDDAGNMLSGFRQIKPQQGYWTSCGGRMMRGDTFEETASLKVKGELGLDVPKDRFNYVSTYSTSFTERQLPPQENGTHTVNALMVLTVTTEERKEIDANLKLDGEHERSDWVDLSEVMDKDDDRFPPALRQMATDVYDFLTTPDKPLSHEEAAFRALTALTYLRSQD